jgi:uncharacterized protein (TIGR03118 family)
MKHNRIVTHVQRIAALAIAAAALVSSASAQTQHYTQTNLVSNLPGVAAVTDPNLVNPWGLSRSSGGDWWIADNGTGLSTLYDGTGKITPLVVTIPPSDPKSTTGGVPTGTIFNGGTGFQVAAGKSAIFLFVTEDGTISGWNPGVNPTAAVIKVNEGQASVFKGATLATIDLPYFGEQTLLYVANFRKGRVEIYDSMFQHIPDIEPLFHDSWMPKGYAPFNVQNVGGDLYVTYAKQDSAKHDEIDGAGLGYVDIFSPYGFLIRRLQHGSWLNAPWGVALASGDFGKYSHDVLVGNFGSGEITVFDPQTGAYLGKLDDATGKPIVIGGLWGLSFGNGASAGSATALYFAAGSNGEQNGLLGSIAAVENIQGNDQ